MTGHRTFKKLLGPLILLGAAFTEASLDLAIETWDLEDGTTVVFLFDDRIPTVDITAYFPVSRYSSWIGENGRIAFWAQARDSSRRASKLGMTISTNFGTTSATFHGSSLSSDFGKLITLMKQVMSNRDFDKKELRKARRTKWLSWKSSLKDPEFVRSQLATRTIYPQVSDPRRASYEKPERTSINVQKLADTRDAILRVPGRIITVSGNVHRDTVREAIRDLLPPPDDSLSTKVAFPSPADLHSGIVKTAKLKRLAQTYIALIRTSIPRTSDDYPAFVLVNYVLGGHFESRLSKALRHDEGDTYSVRSSTRFSDTATGMLYLSTFTRAANEANVVKKLKVVLEEMRKDGITETERRNSLSFFMGRKPFRQETPSQVVSIRARNIIRGLEPDYWQGVLNRASKLTLEELNAFAKEFCDPKRFALIRVVPE